MIDQNTRSARKFYFALRQFAQRAQPWDLDVIWYMTRPDEIFDLTLVSQRVYGRRDEFFAVMAAAGLDHLEQALPQKQIALPNEGKLYAIKRQTGFESRDEFRQDFAPTWDNIFR